MVQKNVRRKSNKQLKKGGSAELIVPTGEYQGFMATLSRKFAMADFDNSQSMTTYPWTTAFIPQSRIPCPVYISGFKVPLYGCESEPAVRILRASRITGTAVHSRKISA
jgi:hypothetical protein